ncbi:unnamed protein product [Onchocerca ochengi]|uniref:Inward rectifier potassium channel C-terminal domain-containing protein n=1 Tax=Onchocerca ochengi TaxID=42157 RepID=A0A182EGC0_ONCOC|nr:unnamed protein product [Onchocerca ochengi]
MDARIGEHMRHFERTHAYDVDCLHMKMTKSLEVSMNYVITISAPNDVIWKHEFYFLILDEKRFDSVVYPISKVFSGCGGSSS